MCAIAGLWLQHEVDPPTLRAWIESMLRPMHHRGPDGGGVWMDPQQGVALGHRRLSIRDPGSAAAQPMADPSGRSWLVFNGELDNHRSWRAQLEASCGRLGHRQSIDGPVRQSFGDTEVLLHALHRWGVETVCKNARGMWAWALFDRNDQRLTLARDRMGKKPLYWVQGPWGMAFASQLQALRALPWLQPQIDPTALAHYLQWGFVVGPSSILSGVEHAPPGHSLSFENARQVHKTAFWSLTQCRQDGQQQRLDSAEAAQAELQQTLRAAVRDRLQADVPVGAFLSGGIDSALVVAQMQDLGANTRTFSMGFDDPDHDESQDAAALAHILGTHHDSSVMDGAQALDLMAELPRIMDEPLADASLLPTTALARRASASVKVALTGDGGDEAFGGYARYRLQGRRMARLADAPESLRHALARGLEAVRPEHWALMARGLAPRWRPTLVASKVDKLARWLRAPDSLTRSRVGLQLWAPEQLGLQARPDAGPSLDQSLLIPGRGDSFDRPLSSEDLQHLEMGHYLVGDLLAKMDRATMWCGVEARSPLLDHRVIELAWRIPPALKAEGPRLKEILRRSLAQHVHPAQFDRPKRGFTAPLARWLRSDLREAADDLIDSLCRHTEGRWNTRLIRTQWAAQQTGQIHAVDRLWALIVLELWRQEWKLDLPN